MAKSKSPFTGSWHINSMTGWEDDAFNEEVQAFEASRRFRSPSEPIHRGKSTRNAAVSGGGVTVLSASLGSEDGVTDDAEKKLGVGLDARQVLPETQVCCNVNDGSNCRLSLAV